MEADIVHAHSGEQGFVRSLHLGMLDRENLTGKDELARDQTFLVHLELATIEHGKRASDGIEALALVASSDSALSVYNELAPRIAVEATAVLEPVLVELPLAYDV